MKKKCNFISKVVKITALLASIGGIAYLCKDKIKAVLSSEKPYDEEEYDVEEENEDDDFDDAVSADEDATDREYVSIDITGDSKEDEKDAEDPADLEAEEEDEEEENA